MSNTSNTKKVPIRNEDIADDVRVNVDMSKKTVAKNCLLNMLGKWFIDNHIHQIENYC